MDLEGRVRGLTFKFGCACGTERLAGVERVDATSLLCKRFFSSLLRFGCVLPSFELVTREGDDKEAVAPGAEERD